MESLRELGSWIRRRIEWLNRFCQQNFLAVFLVLVLSVASAIFGIREAIRPDIGRNELVKLVEEAVRNVTKPPDMKRLQELAAARGKDVDALLDELARGTSFDQGLAALAKGEYDRAADLFEKGPGVEREKDVEALLLKGNALYWAKNYEAAASAYEQATNLDPSLASAYYNWGTVLAQLGQSEEAMEKFRRAVELDPKDPAARYGWGWALAELGRHEEAIEKYEQAVELDPKDADAHYNWGTALAELGRHEEATEKFRRAAELNPEDPAAHYNWGAALARLGRREEAMEKFQRVVELDPKDALAYYGLGWGLAELGRYGEAVEKLRRALELDPGLEGMVVPLLEQLENPERSGE